MIVTWELYLFKSEKDIKKHKCFLSPASQEGGERNYIPRMGESIEYGDTDEIYYIAKIVHIVHSYRHNSIDILAVIEETIKVE